MVNLIARAPRGGGGEGFCLVIVREEFQFYIRLKFHLRINTPSFHTHFFRLFLERYRFFGRSNMVEYGL